MNTFEGIPGVYVIKNTKHHVVYVGETVNLARRFLEHQKRLPQGLGGEGLVQAWIDYGSEFFLFEVLESGPELKSKEKRLEREGYWILQFQNDGSRVLNMRSTQADLPSSTPLALKDQTLFNQSQEYRDKISALNKGRASQQRTAIVYDGQVFFSYSEAAEILQLSRTALRAIMQDPANLLGRLATPEEVVAEKQRRLDTDIQKLSPQPIGKKRTGLKSKIWVQGTIYNSITQAAKAANVSSTAIWKKLNNKTPGYFYINEQNQRYLKNPDGGIEIVPEDLQKEENS
jgi:group I intron endonuclease